MRSSALAWIVCVILFVLLGGAACARRSTVPASISDEDFWRLSESLSEPPGIFAVSDNFVSNEPKVAENARGLRPAGGVAR